MMFINSKIFMNYNTILQKGVKTEKLHHFIETYLSLAIKCKKH